MVEKSVHSLGKFSLIIFDRKIGFKTLSTNLVASCDHSLGIELIAHWTALFLLTHLEDNGEASGYIYGDRNSDPRINIISQTVPESDNILGLVRLLLLGLLRLKK